MDKAIDWLRVKGLAQAAKKAGRIAAEGAVVAYMTPCGCTGALVEVNCETDFVAKTDDFKKELVLVINSYRFGDGEFLSGRSTMSKFCYEHPESSYEDDRNQYGVRVDTERYSYLMRLNPNRGEYNLYCYCYQKEWLNAHLKNAERGIRFIDPYYQEQFRIADGEKISIKLGDGKTMERTCRYIGDYHLEVGTNLYHICEFAELCERNGHTVEPAAKENTKPAKDKEKTR